MEASTSRLNDPWQRAPAPAAAPAAEVILFRDATATVNTTAYSDLVSSPAVVAWPSGATPQIRVRVFAQVNAGAALDMTLAVALAAQDAAAVEGTYGTEVGDTAVNCGNTFQLIDTGWFTPTVMPTPAAFLNVKPRGKSANTTNGKTWKSLLVEILWP